MKMYTKLFVAAAILVILPTRGLTQLIAIFCFMAGLFLVVIQGLKDILNKDKTPSKKDYTEAYKAYEDISKKRKQDNTPPWEQ